MYNKKYVIMVAVAILASVVAAMAYANSDGWKNRKQRDTVEIIADSSSFVESSNSSIVESSSTAESSSNAESSKIEDSSSLNESSLSENSESESSTEICNSENVQNESEIGQTETVYVEVNSNQTYFEPVENNAYVGEPVKDNKTYEVVEIPKSVGDAPVGYTEADVELLASLINHESSFTDEGRLMVGSVVINRMNNTGDSLYDTIAAPHQFVSPWGLNYYTDADYEAAEYVLENGATNTDAYYFTGCHPDGLNWFTDYDGNWVGAY